jgi:hypothetical protein
MHFAKWDLDSHSFYPSPETKVMVQYSPACICKWDAFLPHSFYPSPETRVMACILPNEILIPTHFIPLQRPEWWCNVPLHA